MNVAGGIVDLVRARTGLALPDRDHRRMVQAFRTGARQEGCRSLSAYGELLAGDERALGRLAARLTVGETYFFRDAAQMQLVRDTVLPDVASVPTGAVIRLWSAGCSSGEEAYSLAMLADEADLLGRVEVRGTDISPIAVHLAREAHYGAWSLRAVDERRRRRFFQDAPTTFVVRQEICDRVRISVGNLLDAPPGRFDVILCRNVLIYLSADGMVRAGVTLRDALRPDGWLITGASDPPLDLPGLQRVRTAHGLAYRRRSAAPRTPVPIPDRLEPASPLRATGQGCGVAVRPLRRSCPPASAEPVAANLDEIERLRGLADSRPRHEVERELALAVAASPGDARLRCLAALLHLGWEQCTRAVEQARAAIFLDPGLVVAHLVLGNAEQQRGNRHAARRSYRTTAQLLAHAPADEVVWGADGRRAGELATLARQLSERMRLAG